MFDAIKTFITRQSGPRVLYECRHCGTTLEADTEQCPACGTREIARFVL